MLSPKIKTNLKKFRKGRIHDHLRSRGDQPAFGSFALQTTSLGMITSRHLETVRRLLKRNIKKKGHLWLQVFPTIAKTKKPEKTRMGKGKGRLSLWYFPSHPGKVLFEVGGDFSSNFIRALFKKASYKLPCSTRVIYNK
jgi:large subunit ribosomal protein L16